MTTARIRALTSVLRSQTKPVLAKDGFSFDSSSRTFRKVLGELVQIINFQAGVRFMEGQFTVNLGVFHPQFSAVEPWGSVPPKPHEYDCVVRHRLSMLRPPGTVHSVFALLPNGLLKRWLTTPRDRWWRFTDNEDQIKAELRDVEVLLKSRGLPWLAEHCNLAVVKEAYEERRPAPAGA
jgi:hypothetical protein